jgi:hypothetical protein
MVETRGWWGLIQLFKQKNSPNYYFLLLKGKKCKYILASLRKKLYVAFFFKVR